MNKSKIEWCDMTWNPVTGCLHNCPYCYARRIAERFGLDFAPKLDDPGMEGACKYDSAEGIDTMLELEKPYTKGGRIQPYPMAFLPTFHRYRLNEPARKTKGQKIFVCSMADLFGNWVPDEWIEEVFKACEAAPQHKYMFLTKNPKRYERLEAQNKLPCDFWYGATATKATDLILQASSYKTFVSVEPMLEAFPPDFIADFHVGLYQRKYPEVTEKGLNWVIIGAETGNRKGKAIPKREWVESIVQQCKAAGTPVFMKNSLKDLMGDDFIQEWPEGLR